jgi:hypothetical protein
LGGMMKDEKNSSKIFGVTIPENLQGNSNIWQKVVKNQFIYSIIGLVLGLICILLGAFLCYAGITGTSDWTIKLFGLESNLFKATPGVILFVIGFLVIWLTKYDVKTRKK